MQKSFNHLGEVPSDQHGEYITVIAPKHTVEIKKKKKHLLYWIDLLKMKGNKQDWPMKITISLISFTV